MNGVVKAARAIADLEELAFWFGQRSLDDAMSLLRAAEETFDFLGLFPQSGDRLRAARRGKAEVRIFTLQKYKGIVVLFRPFPDGVQILRVVRGRRNWRRLLSDL